MTAAGRPFALRVGQGFDIHPFVGAADGGADTDAGPARPLVLGGVTFDGAHGLAGHSDADAIAHAVTDALLGAAGEGDIGSMFPDTDPANRMRDSLEMLTLAMSHLRDRGWRAGNIDVTVIAELPRVAPYREAMRDALAGALNLERSAVSVKGKTNEGMGWIGRGEGIACIAVATVVPVAS